MAKLNPYQTTDRLIANAVSTARIFGESPKITRLVASSVGRFAAEMDEHDDGSAGDALLGYALAAIGPEEAEHVPVLRSRLAAIAAARL